MKNIYMSLLGQANQFKANNRKAIMLDAMRYTAIMFTIAYVVGFYLPKSPSYSLALQHPTVNSMHFVFLAFQEGFRYDNDVYSVFGAVFFLLSVSNILSVGQSRFLTRLMRGQRACLIEATTHGFTQYRWVRALLLTCIEILMAFLGCFASFIIVMCIGPAWQKINVDGALAGMVVFFSIFAVSFFPYFYVSTLSYHLYYLMADKNTKGLALFEKAHAITKRVGFVKTVLLRFRHGINLVLMLAIGVIFDQIVYISMDNLIYETRFVLYAIRFTLVVLPTLVIAPFKAAVNTILYEHYYNEARLEN